MDIMGVGVSADMRFAQWAGVTKWKSRRTRKAAEHSEGEGGA
jgi:hypothetical protein